MGRLGFEAIISRDYSVIIALTVLTAFAFTIANLIADVLYGVVDPRIRT
jgi:peptide/nickel transport system permease protein